MTLNSIDFGFNPVPKPSHNRKAGKRGDRAEFPDKVRKAIRKFFRDECAECGRTGETIHHIKFRSQSGRGVFTNGLLLCTKCHVNLHRENERQRKWQFWAEKLYGPNYYMDDEDLGKAAPRKAKKPPVKKKPKGRTPKSRRRFG